MKKRVLSLFLTLTLCLTLLPTAAFAEGETGGSMSGNTTIGGGTGGGVLVGENEKPGGGFVVPAEQNGSGNAVAEAGGKQYDTLDEILGDMEPVEITLLGNVTEDITVYAETTIHMNGFSITGDIDATDSLTLTNGTVTGKVTVTVDATEGTFTMTAPADADAAIDGGLNVVSGSCSVSGAKIGVNGTLFFGGTDMTITGTDKAVELTAAAEPSGKKFHGSTNVGGDTAEEATFDGSTYQVSGGVAKKLSYSSVTPEPSDPTLTLSPTEKTINAGKTATFTATYTGTGALNAYIQKNGIDDNFTVDCVKDSENENTYTISVETKAETFTGTYTLYVHEVENAFVQAEATINVISTVAKDDKDNYYPTIKDAIEQAQDGSTITVIAAKNQISLPDDIYVENQTGITLDLNGHSLDGHSLNVGGLTARAKFAPVN